MESVRKIPLPVVIVVVVVAIAVAIWSMRRSVGVGGGHLPTGPPSGAAMQQMRQSGATGAGAMSNPNATSGTTMPSGGTGAPNGR